MSEEMGAILFIAFMFYCIGAFLFGVSGIFGKEENSAELLWISPVWPLFWLKFVWKKLRE